MQRLIDKIRSAILPRAAWLLPLIIAVVGIIPALYAVRAQTFAILGRDQGIFQYVAWAMRHGERTYRDIHEINGPLPHAWHMIMQGLGGEDEHIFRSIDAGLLIAIYSFAATTIPRWIGLDLERNEDDRKGRRRVLFVWLLAGLTVMGTEYSRYDWWHTAQREALYSLLILTSLSLQSIVHTTRSVRVAHISLLFAGITTSLTWFGKPPCAVFSILQAAVLIYDRKNLLVSLRAALGTVFIGTVGVATAMYVFVAKYEDMDHAIELLSKVPKLHHTIWNETLLGSYNAFNNGPRLDWAFGTFLAFMFTYRIAKLPRRALLACVLPVGGILVFAGQGKAFPYHLHMVTLGMAVQQLAIVAALARYMQDASTAGRKLLPLITAALCLVLGLKCLQDAVLSPAVRHHWMSAGSTKAKRTTHEYYDQFPWGDYFPNDLHTAAAYLDFHTRPDERVQIYGFDPYLLFLARRKSATPVMYSFELNVDAAQKGGPGAKPTPELSAWLDAYAFDAETLVLTRVEQTPPAAFALFDRAPWTFPENSEADFAKHCPRLYAFMTSHYVNTASFGTIRIWLRRDVVDRTHS